MLIEMMNVSFTYMPDTSLEQLALQNTNLGIDEGEFIGLIGPTGSGKSTLVQLLSALLIPAEGKILFKGKEIGRDIEPHIIRKEVGLVFQFPENQLFAETVADDVAFGPRNLGLSEGQANLNAREALESVGLAYERYADRSPFSLSGGEKRLVAIAGILAMKPRVLTLDEPITGLDYWGRTRVLRYIDELNRNGMTVIIVAHDMDEIAEYVDRVVVLSEGQIVLDGRPKDVFSQIDYLRDIGLDIPKTVELLMKLRDRGFNVTVESLGMQPAINAVLAAVKEKHCL